MGMQIETRMQAAVLDAEYREDRVKQKELGQRFGVSRQAIAMRKLRFRRKNDIEHKPRRVKKKTPARFVHLSAVTANV